MDSPVPKILIVDDDAGVRMSLTRTLKARGYETSVMASGAEALAFIKEERVNLALIDIRLPDISGLEILKALRKINENSAVIMMTAYASLDSCVEALNVGAYAYIIKPMNLNQALIIIEKAFEKQRLSSENSRLVTELKSANEKLEERVAELQSLQAEKLKLIDELQKALTEVKTLSGILSICSGCKKIRDEKGNWVQVESYVSNHVDVMFSHGMCPDCVAKFYPKQVR
ncbi:MAG TPA: response regulator [Candidatus Wallbacteria bacterium]|nr:MAG: Sporulation initiation phosphotransferase F [bacterium ADurb.Bin243]HOD42195.1 response regulator [Candidatus Wallbacteria bacterium]HPG59045.1 response regulator [Candidatus Wallbacteria bacterium]